MSKIVAAAIESSGNLTLRAGGADRVTVESDGQVGIGTASPSAPLHVSDLTAEVRITAPTITGADWGILPQTSNSTPVFRIYDRYNDLDRLTISSAGLVTIPVALQVTGNAGSSAAPTVGTHLCNKTYVDGFPRVKAWVTFTGTGTVNVNCTIRNSYGVTSVAHTAVGEYTINFNTTQTTADYCVNACNSLTDAGHHAPVITSMTTQSVGIKISKDIQASYPGHDAATVCVSILY